MFFPHVETGVMYQAHQGRSETRILVLARHIPGYLGYTVGRPETAEDMQTRGQPEGQDLDIP